ncbi:lipoyl synthase [Aliarcobacter skirrowii]|jgi:lipoic acid synthetase|uniref:Lipoyl synthase n=2 Tax=Aliarcobacter skirrowii TaxID=28200 RepID=A0AAD0SLX2_9BACT|nr:lipoyl synthase [Aliarcobacter skirrowii]AXX84557.1 lipoic acid synthetase [Aliarcobacter skirrowii CCUG 10374]KAB0621271.1 lipoyl synthase [Aliarcobacter skirrowii CCUG 10374]MDD2508498.1 lipoyl synthase [Aliarcobacter skirrowii]MDD3497297.1 lipoyl synthase [Aliarcobacter skirrowii]MDX4027543.1 lipoyl synthase [Aliarcobacter skirrowii]
MTQQIDFKERANFKKPEWLRKKLTPHAQIEMENLLKDVGGLHTICQEAKCPNISECFANKNATFLILGNICTRRCTYCNVTTGKPHGVDLSEIQKVTTSVLRLGLKFVVITSPARDDLADGGAEQFYRVTKDILEKSPQTKVEILIPDFKANEESLKRVIDSGATIIGHNVETVPSLYRIRRNGTYERSLEVLRKLKELGGDKIKTKSALMVGLGETEDEMIAVFKDLLSVGCKFLSIGQYLAPSGDFEKVIEYVKPEQFKRYEQLAYDLGFEFVKASPYARSSYMAHQYLQE